MTLDIAALEAQCRARIEPGPYRHEFDRGCPTSEIVEGLATRLMLTPKELQDAALRTAMHAFNLPIGAVLEPDRFRWLATIDGPEGFIVWDIVTATRKIVETRDMFR